MAMTLASEGEEDVVSTINTTPLVDVMLVLLIIFLITSPVVIKSVPIKLPVEKNIVLKTKPENINLAVTKDGDVFWNRTQVTNDELLNKLKGESQKNPQPEVHIRGDQTTRYESIGKVIMTAQRAGIAKVSFITSPQVVD